MDTTFRYALAAALAGLFVLAPGVGVAQDESAEPLASVAPITEPEGEWVVTAFDAWEQGLSEPLPDSRLTVSLLADGQLEGETGCGRFNGGWSAEGPEIFMGVAPSGNLGCAEQETAEAIGLATALAAVGAWRATDTGIELLDALGNPRVVLAQVTPAEPLGDWDVVLFRRPDGELREPRADGPMSMTLDEDGGVEGDTGCRLLLGEYAWDGAGIALGPLEAQGAPCEDAVMRAERQLLRALGEAVYWSQEDEALRLFDGFDELLVELVLAPEDEG